MNIIRTRFAFLIGGTLAIALPTHSIHAGPNPVGSAFTYQGQLKQGGNNVDTTADFQFSLWDAAAGPAQIGVMQPADGVAIADGLFTLDLDFGAGAFGGDARWLEIAVRSPAGAGAFVTLTPRQPITSTPVAQFALGVDGANVTNLNASNLASGSVADTLLSGNVGMLNAAQTFKGANTFSAAPSFTSAGAPFSVTSTTLVTNLNADLLDGLDSTAFLQSIPIPLTLSGTSATHIIRGENASTADGASGVVGLSTAASVNFGVSGQSNSTSGTGVRGLANALSGINYGVWGASNSSAGTGVFGFAAAASGVNYGVFGQSISSSGYGVFGYASALSGTNYGVWGRSDSSGGIGVSGWASALSGTNYGGDFASNSPDGRGVRGAAHATTGLAVGGRFASASTGGIGVWSTATASSGTTYGVQGVNSNGSGWGVYAVGHLGASGVKAFRIDHPDDPANKYLLHYAAESPEVINFYRGTVMLDGAGEAVVELPHYFSKINKDPSYVLTAVGAAMPNLHVAQEIDESALSAGATAEPDQAAPLCTFRIAGGAPGMKVSWEVKAVRNDRWVQQRGAPVEIEKEGLEKGTYQHPELYGQPPEKGMNYDAAREEREKR